MGLLAAAMAAAFMVDIRGSYFLAFLILRNLNILAGVVVLLAKKPMLTPAPALQRGWEQSVKSGLSR